jgi:hypothetical protein
MGAHDSISTTACYLVIMTIASCKKKLVNFQSSQWLLTFFSVQKCKLALGGDASHVFSQCICLLLHLLEMVGKNMFQDFQN